MLVRKIPLLQQMSKNLLSGMNTSSGNSATMSFAILAGVTIEVLLPQSILIRSNPNIFIVLGYGSMYTLFFIKSSFQKINYIFYIEVLKKWFIDIT